MPTPPRKKTWKDSLIDAGIGTAITISILLFVAVTWPPKLKERRTSPCVVTITTQTSQVQALEDTIACLEHMKKLK